MEYKFSDKISSLQPSVIREILKFTSEPGMISFAAGNPAPEAFPVEDVRRMSKEILENTPILALQYSVTEGYPPLREALMKMAKARYNVGRDFDQLLVVSGAQQGVDLAARVLLNEGDTVICEDPSFIGSLNAFRSYNAKLAGVAMDEDGMNIEALEAALKANPKAKFIYTIPNFQNPSGITMSLQKRREVYRLAKAYGVFILEDNPYGELRWAGEDIPAIKALDEDGIVFYCGSFSKVLSPGIRVGYVVAPAPVIAKMTVAKQCNDVHTTIMSQLLCHRFITECDLDAHIEGLRKIYEKKSSLMMEHMDREFSKNVHHTVPQGGLFLWCTLPQGSDMMGFCRKAVAEKVAVVPGNAFTSDETAPSYSFRMNFSTPTDEQIVQGVKILGRLTHQMFD
ncbi:MAG: PLP-dependent aminotransferase family protein [Oscillospiraceae bacterium]|nr:PLP-dependent aminotransferase family protein [Oscillospiraceae bacterium]